MAVWIESVISCKELGIDVKLEMAEGSGDIHVSVTLTRELSPSGTFVISAAEDEPGYGAVQDLGWLARVTKRTVQHLRHQAFTLHFLSRKPADEDELWRTSQTQFPNEDFSNTLWVLEDKGLIEKVPGHPSTWRRTEPHDGDS
jgi:hypothetical protein